jgi:hypothetical protein
MSDDSFEPSGFSFFLFFFQNKNMARQFNCGKSGARVAALQAASWTAMNSGGISLSWVLLLIIIVIVIFFAPFDYDYDYDYDYERNTQKSEMHP